MLFDSTSTLEAVPPQVRTVNAASEVADVMQAVDALEQRYAPWLQVDATLTRSLVSFQANKERKRYRWYKYKEGFSADLVEYFLQRFGIRSGCVLDPFAGSGAALFAASGKGLEAHGIELLPVGLRLMEARQLLEAHATPQDLAFLQQAATERPWSKLAPLPLNELRITQHAYPVQTQQEIGQCLAWVASLEPLRAAVASFALLAVLEAVSYTRKDGQYLRWDHRSSRKLSGRSFDKGVIQPFAVAYSAKLLQMVEDVAQTSVSEDLFHVLEQPRQPQQHRIVLYPGSCLEHLPRLPDEHFDAIITSPPYCNRYDYTRTYALELALLGCDEAGLVALRQQMLSCTVENREKDLRAMHPVWNRALVAVESHATLQRVLDYLERLKAANQLNNNGIPRMVKGYFQELACVVQECARVLKPGAALIMVNDNVRYAGIAIPVDLILSDLALALGLRVESILVLPNGKGNSSQQMGEHGRHELRKCVYVWRKAHA